MTTWNPLATLSLCVAQLAGGSANAEPGDDYRLSGPEVHENLAIYFVHGKSRSGPVPLTLAEALAKNTIEVRCGVAAQPGFADLSERGETFLAASIGVRVYWPQTVVVGSVEAGIWPEGNP
jgi:hypothetical protein